MPVFTVPLPKTTVPEFPNVCVACLADAPTASVRMFTSAIGWWTAFFAFGAIHRVDVPACKPCAGRLWRSRVLRFVVTVLCIAAGIGVASHFAAGMRWRHAIVLGSGLVALIPAIAWQVLVPAALDITAYENTVDYDFRDPDYAGEFASLNGGSIE